MKKTITNLRQIGWSALFILGICVAIAIGVDVNIFHSIGMHSFGLIGTKAILFALCPLIITKVVSIYYKNHLYQISRQTEDIKRVPNLHLLILFLLVMMVAGGISRYCNFQLNQIEHTSLNESILESLKNPSEKADTKSIKPTDSKNSSRYTELKFWADLVVQVLLAMLLIVVSGLLFAFFELALTVCLKRRKEQKNKEALLQSITTYEHLLNKRELTIKSYAEIGGLLTVYEYNDSQFGLK